MCLINVKTYLHIKMMSCLLELLEQPFVFESNPYVIIAFIIRPTTIDFAHCFITVLFGPSSFNPIAGEMITTIVAVRIVGCPYLLFPCFSIKISI